MTFAKVWTLAFVLIRLILCVRYFVSLTPSVLLFGLSELLSIVWTVASLRGVPYASTPLALIVPVCYTAPLLLKASGNGWPVFGLLIALLSVLQACLRLYMGKSITVGTPNFRGILTHGPYKFCRHPLAVTEMMIVLCFALRFLTVYNLLAAMLALLASLLAVSIEEQYLFRFAEYRRYARAVRSRFFPGWF